jgi:hypothetical protein
MEIYKFNINDNKEKVIRDLIRIYREHTELFEDEAYCHFNIDADDVTVFNKTSESEYSCACDYNTDECGWIYDDEIKDCIEYFYDEIMEVTDCRHWFKV